MGHEEVDKDKEDASRDLAQKMCMFLSEKMIKNE